MNLSNLADALNHFQPPSGNLTTDGLRSADVVSGCRKLDMVGTHLPPVLTDVCVRVCTHVSCYMDILSLQHQSLNNTLF